MITRELFTRGLASLILVSICRTGLADQVSMSDWVIERSNLSHAVEEGQSVAVVNPYGDIRARSGDDGEIAVYAVIQRHRDDNRGIPEITFAKDNDKLTVGVAYPGPAGMTLPERFAKRRTDIAVFVPPTLELTLKTQDGRAESKGHKEHLVVQTRAGRIIAATKGTIEARTDSGSIKVEFRNRTWNGASTLESKSGDISVFLMSDPSVSAVIDTAGTITTDYSIDIEHTPGSSRKIARAEIGSAQHELNISSAAGAVRLGRVFDMVPATLPPAESKTGNETDG